MLLFKSFMLHAIMTLMTAKRKIPRRKRSDTKMGSIEKKYGRDFEVRSDMQLGTYLEKRGYSSLSKLLKKNDSKRTSKRK